MEPTDCPLCGEAAARVILRADFNLTGAAGTAYAVVECLACHLRYLNPFPSNLGEILYRFDKVLVPELNAGQLALLLRARYLIDAISYSKVQGKPFKIAEIVRKIEELLEA